MNRSVAWLLSASISITALAAGCGSDAPPPPPQNVSAVLPSSAFLGRTADVVISGDNTAWATGTTVSFGAGINVDNVVIASPTALLATITITNDAPLGAHDVLVSAPGANGEAAQNLTYAGAFKVESPIQVTALGSLAQGSIILLTVRGLDFGTPFDSTSTGDGFFTPLEFTNISLDVPHGMTASISNVSDYAVDATILVDLDAQTGPLDVNVISGPAGGPKVEFPMPGALDIMARTPAPLSAGAPANGSVANPYDTLLYAYTPTAGAKLVDMSVMSSSTGGSPGLVLLPKSGKFADLIDFNYALTFLTTTSDPYYVIAWDNTGVTSNLTITTTATNVTTAMDTPTNGSKDMATTIATLPAAVTNGSLDDASDEDWFVVDVAEADIGKYVHVRTLPGDPLTDTWVDVYGADGATSLGGPSDDSNYHEDFYSSGIENAGQIYVKIYASSVYDSAHKPYLAIITLE